MKFESPIERRKTRKIFVGDVAVGGDAPISVQSMTNTDTCDVDATVAQIRRLEDAYWQTRNHIFYIVSGKISEQQVDDMIAQLERLYPNDSI